MHNKSLVVRLDKTIFNRIKDTAKTLGVTHSQVVRDAIQMYYNPNKEYNNDIVTILKNQVTDLQQQRDTLQNRIDYLLLPWYRRMMLRLPDHKN